MGSHLRGGGACYAVTITYISTSKANKIELLPKSAMNYIYLALLIFITLAFCEFFDSLRMPPKSVTLKVSSFCTLRTHPVREKSHVLGAGYERLAVKCQRKEGANGDVAQFSSRR